MPCLLEVLCVLAVSTYLAVGSDGAKKTIPVELTDSINHFNISEKYDPKYFWSEEGKKTWAVKGPVGRRLEIYCPLIVIPENMHCVYGALTISSRRGIDRTVCSTLEGYRERSVSNWMLVTLKVDEYRASQLKCTIRLLSTDPKTWSNTTEATCRCGRTSSGKAGEEDLTFVASIKRRYSTARGQRLYLNGEALGVGILLTEDHFLTAASCVESKDTISLEVLFGGKTFTIAGYVTFDDMALVELVDPVKNVRPICLSSKPYNLLNQKVTAIGMRSLDESGYKITPRPVKVQLLVTGEDSRKKELTTRTLGAGLPRGANLGAPMLSLDPDTNNYVLVGLLSKETSGIYTHVTAFFDSIQSNLKYGHTCNIHQLL